jgi:hypothetical protein
MAIIINTGEGSYKSDLESAFEALQLQRGALLDMTRGLQLSARVLALQEARRIASTISADDPRVAAYAASSDAMLQRVAALEVETQIARIRVPAVTRAETLLQGRVTASDARALGGVSVTLIDATGAPVASVKPVEADDSGYFAFVLEPAQIEAIGTSRLLTLQIGNEAGKLVPSALKPFSLAAGQVVVSEARLQVGEMDQLKLRPVFAATKRPAGAAVGVVEAPAEAPAPAAQPKAVAPRRKTTPVAKAAAAPRAKNPPKKR